MFILSFLIPLLCHGHRTDSIPSACANGPISSSSTYGFACPVLMMLTDPMIQASVLDHNNDLFVYAVAGSSTDQECGKCYQIQVLDPDIPPEFPQLIVQIVNSGNDVLPYQMDLFMGAGGFGYFTACNVDCQEKYCDGGKCHDHLYDSPYSSWSPSSCYSGGIRLPMHFSDQEYQSVLHQCESLVSDSSLEKNKFLLQSCQRTNTFGWHQNFVNTRLSRIQCPLHLSQLTGFRRTDDIHYPESHTFLELELTCEGDTTNGHYCITTMQDCCKMSCSWSHKLSVDLLDTDYPCVYTCNNQGQIFLS